MAPASSSWFRRWEDILDFFGFFFTVFYKRLEFAVIALIELSLGHLRNALFFWELHWNFEFD